MVEGAKEPLHRAGLWVPAAPGSCGPGQRKEPAQDSGQSSWAGRGGGAAVRQDRCAGLCGEGRFRGAETGAGIGGAGCLLQTCSPLSSRGSVPAKGLWGALGSREASPVPAGNVLMPASLRRHGPGV